MIRANDFNIISYGKVNWLHNFWVRSVVCNPDSKNFASVSDDETLKIWDIKTGKCLKTLRAPRPYEGMNITRITGISEAEKANLKALGAVED